MNVALDTNILIEIRGGQPRAAKCATLVAIHLASGNRVLISNVVYAELLAGAGTTPPALDALLAQYGIRRHRSVHSSEWERAGVAFQGYAARRRAGKAPPPRRILADFLIGAHAEAYADALMTLNPSDFSTDFPGLPLIVP
ncbi:type II toxin-antitoxin system VapC family toxin [Deinococcus soli (ex Cha et al. 2016)]|uniref:type II toxin-antitoxin system VapC family toxin n=1 Tax=Deinococcus soli (ex Cha et al. 2016) TaxID=1309411 RepID=UPI0009D69328